MSQFLNDLVDLCAGTTLTVSPFVSVDKSNQATYASPVTYTVQMGGPVKFMHRESNQQMTSSQTLYIFSPDQISAKDKFTLPSGYDGTRTPKVLQVDRATDELGFCYTTIYLG